MYDHKGLDVDQYKMLNVKDDLIDVLTLPDTSDIAPVLRTAKAFLQLNFFFLFFCFFFWKTDSDTFASLNVALHRNSAHIHQALYPLPQPCVKWDTRKVSQGTFQRAPAIG